MKILYLLHSSGVSEGSSIAVISIIKEMQKKGHLIFAVCPKQGPLVEILKELNVKVFFIRYANMLYPKVVTIKSFFSWPMRLLVILWNNHLAERSLKKLVKDIQPDIIHTNVGVLMVGLYVAKKMGIPHVWHIRETDDGLGFNHFPCRKFQRKALISNDINIAITESVRQHYLLTSNNTKVIYDGVFSTNYHTQNVTMKSNYFLFVGRVLESKGADWAVESFFKVARQHPDMELWLAGSDNNKFANSLKTKVNNSSYNKRVKFLGQRNDIYELMAHAQAVLVPSVMEGFGFITVEAMVNKTLVIGRNSGGTKEQFDNGLKITGHEIGLRCESIDDMTEHMLDVCKYGQSYYDEMISSAYMVVQKLYTIEHNADQIEKIYNQIKK